MENRNAQRGMRGNEDFYENAYLWLYRTWSDWAGSIARALKKYDYNIKVIAYDVNRDALSAAVPQGLPTAPPVRLMIPFPTVIIFFYARRFRKMTVIWQP